MDTSYHHGALRETLLADGRRLLVEEGIDAVTLRELARRAGVSHGAPRRHFDDRDALLDALAARGFDDLASVLEVAAREEGLEALLTTYARAFVRFAVENGALVNLMFASKAAAGNHAAAERFFSLGARLLGEDSSESVGSPAYLVAATLEGISSLVIAGRLPESRIDEIVAAAVAMLLPVIGKA